MTWGAPLLAGIVALIAIPALLILYFLKLRRKTVEISTTLLWRQAIQDLQANAPFQKLRKNILLLLQLLALAAILLALAQPRMDVGAEYGRRLVILIDRSASMQAEDTTGARTRLDAAKQSAIDLVNAMSSGGVLSGEESADQAMVIAFDVVGEPLTKFTGDKARLIAAIESIEPTDAGSSIAEAYKLAQAGRPKRTFLDDAGGTQPETELVVEGQVQGPAISFELFSDGRIDDLTEVILREDKRSPEQGGGYANTADAFTFHAVGQPAAGNLAIVGATAARGFERPAVANIYVSIQSTDTAPREVDVELEIDGQGVVRIQTVQLDPAEVPAGTDGPPRPSSTGIVFELDNPAGYLARVRLADPRPDVLPTDNEALVPVPPAKQAAVALVTPGNVFLPLAFQAMNLAEFVTWTPAQYDAARASGDADRFDIIVLDRTPPPTDENGNTEPGRYLVLGAVPPPPFGVTDLGEGPGDSFLSWSRVHPVLRDVALGNVRISKSRLVQVPDGAPVAVLAELTGGPGILEITRAGARAIVVPWDVADSTWPFKPGFIVFLAGAVDYLSRDAADAASGGGSRQLLPGDVLTTRIPQGATDARVRLPNGDDVPVQAAADGTVVYGPLQHVGLYRVSWQGDPGPTDVVSGNRASRVYAANLLSPAESDLGARATLDLGSRAVTATDRTGEKRREYWPWLLLAALAVMMLEWYVFNRKVHI
ncbi:MAG: VWA domain-containing protein [Phycisphaerales bacterium JB040]